MSTSSSPIGSPETSTPTSLYEDAVDSCTDFFPPGLTHAKEAIGSHLRYTGVQRTARTRTGSLSSSEYNPTRGTSPYFSQKSKHKKVVRLLG